MSKPRLVNISVVIPTYKRLDKLEKCLNQILSCDPLPSEILIHIDAGDSETEDFLLAKKYPLVTWFNSNDIQGPGGGRNKLIRRAQSPIVGSFDDDSWPLEKDYFKVAQELFLTYPKVAVIDAQEIRPQGLSQKAQNSQSKEVSSFQSGASLLRREAFLETRGYLPLKYSYGMEEVDLALQLLDNDWKILKFSQLKVFHDSNLAHHSSLAILAANIANRGLLAYLRYPIVYWPLGLLQIINRIWFQVKSGNWNGVIQGIALIPVLLWRYRDHRNPVKPSTLALSRKLAS
jgi:GT2 family glycosyltransferase